MKIKKKNGDYTLPSTLKMASEAKSKAMNLIKDHRFLMISKSWCPDCHYVYKIWDKCGVKDKVHIIEFDKFENQNEALELEKAFTEISGRKWVPTLFFNQKRFGTEADLKDLVKQGLLEKKFKQEGLL